MYPQLDPREDRILERIIKGGITLAKISLARMLQFPINLKSIAIQDHVEEVQFTAKEGRLHVVKTGLMGQIGGACYLILSDEELSQMIKQCMPNAGNDELMREGFLGELDNIMSAAVITEIADYMDIELFGMVPMTHHMDANHLNTFMNREAKKIKDPVFVSAHFQSRELNLVPDYIWIFDQQLAEILLAEEAKAE